MAKEIKLTAGCLVDGESFVFGNRVYKVMNTYNGLGKNVLVSFNGETYHLSIRAKVIPFIKADPPEESEFIRVVKRQQ
tara:strand:- start:218 stop:451 length:234 start_codon:yes stop_codon:yes gene_type:complete